MDYFDKDIKEVYSELDTSEKGLSNEEAKKRLEKYGPNTLKEENKTTALQIFLDQFKSPIVWILIGAVIVSALLKEFVDASVIGVILILNAILGFIQEFKAEKAIEELKKMISLKAVVIRDGKEESIDATEIVPGDILVLEEGDKIPADGRLIEISNLETQEAALTGESTPVRKKTDKLKSDLEVADRKNMIFSGTIITKGRAKAVVTGTGMKTEIGKIAKMISESEDKKTPLQLKLKTLGKFLGAVVLGICVIVFLTGWLTGRGTVTEMFLAAVALAVAAVPEGLPAVVTIALALGVQRMAKKNSLMRKLPSVETLGSTNVICADKTGTLTHNQMTVVKIFCNDEVTEVSGSGYKTEGDFSNDPEKLKLLLRIGSLCNDASLEKKEKKNEVIGDPTEGCLIVSAEKAGLKHDDLKEKYPRIGEIPFSSERKRMSTVHKTDDKKVLYTKGAPDVILKLCSKININGKTSKLTEEKKKKILEQNSKFAKKALRVLGFAYKEIVSDSKISKDEIPESVEKDLVFVGLQAMIDPPREEVKEAIKKCKTAGIKVVMITGDHQETAVAIAKQLGIKGESIVGAEVEKKDIDNLVEKIAVYARVNPSHKKKIVDALQKKGYVVAMTGDGVNDAPALKNADIGIAMGITGTDVSKEASDMILTDDNFASIVKAVKEGRSIYDNIKKFVNYLLSSNLGEVLVIFVASLIGLPLPLLAIHILWMNLITDGLPALALGVDPADPDVMEQKPRKKKARIISKNMTFNVFLIGVLIAAATLFIFNKNLSNGEVFARTSALLTLVLLQLVRVQMVRRKYHSSLLSNKYLILALVVSLALQIAVIYTPLSSLFKLTPVPFIVWGEIAAACIVVYAVGIFGDMIISKFTKETD